MENFPEEGSGTTFFNTQCEFRSDGPGQFNLGVEDITIKMCSEQRCVQIVSLLLFTTLAVIIISKISCILEL